MHSLPPRPAFHPLVSIGEHFLPLLQYSIYILIPFIQKNVFDSFLVQLENGNKEYFENLKFSVGIEKYKSKKFDNSNSFEIKSFEIIYNKQL